MNNKLIYLFVVLVIFFSVNKICYASTNTFRELRRAYSDITVGTKSNDSTGIVTISNSQIQQSIISVIPFLNGMTITSDQTSMIVTLTTAYLIFKATNAAGAITNVAVEVKVTNSSLIFNPTNGREVHVCNSSGDCSSCAFLRMGNRIMSCSCNQNSSGNQNGSGCKHNSTWLH